MSKPLSVLAALLAFCAFTTAPALAAEPAQATAVFQEALFSPVDGVLDFEETTDGIKVAGEFPMGFASPDAADYEVQVLDGTKVVLDLSKDFRNIAEITPPAVADFVFTTKTKTKVADIRNLEVVIHQLVNVAAGIKVQAVIGRAKVTK